MGLTCKPFAGDLVEIEDYSEFMLGIIEHSDFHLGIFLSSETYYNSDDNMLSICSFECLKLLCEDGNIHYFDDSHTNFKVLSQINV